NTLTTNSSGAGVLAAALARSRVAPSACTSEPDNANSRAALASFNPAANFIARILSASVTDSRVCRRRRAFRSRSAKLVGRSLFGCARMVEYKAEHDTSRFLVEFLDDGAARQSGELLDRLLLHEARESDRHL